MFTLYHLESSRSQRIIWLFELLSVDYEIKAYKRDPKTNLAPALFSQLHPLGTAPLIEHNGKIIAESGAICEYVVREANNTSLLPPIDHEERIDVQFWSHYAEGSFTPPLVTSMVLTKGEQKAKPFFVKAIVKKFVKAVMDAYFGMAIERNLNFVNKHLDGRNWLVGDAPTIADVQMSFPLEALHKAGRLSGFSNLQTYVERLHNEPNYAKAMEKLAEAERTAQ